MPLRENGIVTEVNPHNPTAYDASKPLNMGQVTRNTKSNDISAIARFLKIIAHNPKTMITDIQFMRLDHGQDD